MQVLQITGVLLTAALPTFAQSSVDILRFSLDETQDQVVKILRRPTHIDDLLPAFQSWQ